MAGLTTKELTALEEQLNYETVLISKYQTYASMATDPQIKAKCKSIASKHKKHYMSLQKFLSA